MKPLSKTGREFVSLIVLIALCFGVLICAYWALLIALVWFNALDALYYIAGVISDRSMLLWFFVVPGFIGAAASGFAAWQHIDRGQALTAVVTCLLGTVVPILILIASSGAEV